MLQSLFTLQTSSSGLLDQPITTAAGDASHVNPHVYQAAARDAIAQAEDLEKRFAVKMKEAKVGIFYLI